MNNQRNLLVFLLMLFVCAMIVLLCISLGIKALQHIKEVGIQDEIGSWAQILIIILTFFTVLIACLSLPGLSKTLKSDYLLNIDARWNSKPIIKARQIIHRIFVETHELSKEDVLHRALIGNKIIDMRLSTDANEQSDFVYLQNMLDFLETIGYLNHSGDLSIEEVDELLGYSMIKFFEIYKPYILDRRSRRRNEMYAHFERLYIKLLQKKNQAY